VLELALFGAVHVKSSMPSEYKTMCGKSCSDGSRILVYHVDNGCKSYPPPHGECVNYGELGGRSMN